MGIIDEVYGDMNRHVASNYVKGDTPANGEYWVDRITGCLMQRLEKAAEAKALRDRSFTVDDWLFTKKVARYEVESPTPDRDGSMHVVIQTPEEITSPKQGDVVMMYTAGLAQYIER